MAGALGSRPHPGSAGSTGRLVARFFSPLSGEQLRFEQIELTIRFGHSAGPATARELFLAGGLRYHLIEQRQFALTTTQDASEPLHVLALRACTGEHDGHTGLWHIHALIEHARGDDDRVRASAKAL